MLTELFQLQYQQPVYVYWGVATEENLYNVALLDKLCASLQQAQWTAVLSRASATWKGAHDIYRILH